MSNNQGGAREHLPNGLVKEVKYQIEYLSGTDLGEYTYEHTSSEYKDAKTDYFIYNPDGKLVLQGRTFGQRTFFWTPTAGARLANA